jgi:chitinase
VTVKYQTANGSAMSPANYTAVTGTLTFAPGTVQQFVDVPIIGNKTQTSTLLFTLGLSNPTNAVVTRNGQGSILNDDPSTAMRLTIGDVRIARSDSGTRTAVFAVTLSKPATQQVTVNFATANGTAIAGTDYLAVSGTLTFAVGQTTQFVMVTIKGTTGAAPTRAFTVKLKNVVHATLTRAKGTGTIIPNV